MAALRGPWAHFESITVGAFSVLCMFAWLIFPLPRPEKLTEIVGTLTSYSVEADQGVFAGRPASEYVLFRVADHAGRFWSASVTPANVTEVFPRSGLQLHFYCDEHTPYHPVNGDGVKVYGLSVEGGVTLQSAGDELSHDSFLAYYTIPALGVGLLLLAVGRWKRKSRRLARDRD